MHQSIAAVPKICLVLLWFWHTCNAFRVLTQAVTRLAVHLPFVTAATFVFHATSFISSFVPLHYSTFVAKQFTSRQGTLSQPQSKAQVMHIPFRKANATILTGFHSAYTTSYIHIQSTRPISLRTFAACYGCGLSCFVIS